MKISFATTCMGRVHHLMETLPQNIIDNPSTRNMTVEFAVVNYGSRDGMDEWMKTDPFIRSKIEDGTVRYARLPGVDHFHMAHAKNVAHRLATGDVLCNLDADNFTGDGFAAFLAHEFRHNPNIIAMPAYQCSANLTSVDRGFYGRLAITKEHFEQLGGYDENLKGWGGDDCDLRRRAKGLGLQQVQFDDPIFIQAISHSNEERVINMDNAKGIKAAASKIAETGRGASIISKMRTIYNALSKPVEANKGHFGCAQLHEGLEAQPLELKPLNIEIHRSSTPSSCVHALPEMVIGRVIPRIT